MKKGIAKRKKERKKEKKSGGGWGELLNVLDTFEYQNLRL